MQGVSAGGPLGSHPHASSLMALTRDLSRLHFVVGTDTLVLILPLFTRDFGLESQFSIQNVSSSTVLMTIISRRGVVSKYRNAVAPGGEWRVHSCMCVCSTRVHECLPMPSPSTGGSEALAALHPSVWVRMSVTSGSSRETNRNQEARREPLTDWHLAWSGQGLGAQGRPRA